jgi:hypothetical protein
MTPDDLAGSAAGMAGSGTVPETASALGFSSLVVDPTLLPPITVPPASWS